MVSLSNVLITLFAVFMGAGQIVLPLASKETFSNVIVSIKVVFGRKCFWLDIVINGLLIIFP